MTAPRALETLAVGPWDLLVIGGGITGAGIMREAARRGLRVLLLERGDFASGTSSRSSKLVHGGLHYLMRMQVRLAYHSIHERELLLRAEPGLVEPLECLIPTFPTRTNAFPDRLVGAGLSFYEALGGQFRRHPRLAPDAILPSLPGLTPGATGGFLYHDAHADDARLVLRVLHEGTQAGGRALSYVEVTGLLRDAKGRVHGVTARHRETGHETEIRARAVVNATGPWADRLRRLIDAPERVRLIRGSHLVFSGTRLPLTRAIITRHPDSRHPLYLVPWEGCTLIGSTHVEHRADPDEPPRVSPSEAAYLLRGAQALFPALSLTQEDIVAAFAGVRPVVDTVTLDPAKASRDVAFWEEAGLLTVTGGKLTTFRMTARQTLARLRHQLPAMRTIAEPTNGTHLEELPEGLPFDPATALRLRARYGTEGLIAIALLPGEERARIPSLPALWGELRWAARTEEVRHLDDLLLRRVRLGLTTPQGALPLLDRIRPLVQPELGWTDARWQTETAAFRAEWTASHRPPPFTLADHRLPQPTAQPRRLRRLMRDHAR